MTQDIISDNRHPLYPQFERLYGVSFPIFEQRTVDQQQRAFCTPSYQLRAFVEDGVFVGFIASWDLSECIYIEHFAISAELRGAGYGSAVLRDFVSEASKTVVLEIDPIVDQISESRLKFYTKCGFVADRHSHTHPAYRVGYAAHPLVVLCAGRELTDLQYATFNRELTQIVMANSL